MLERFFVTLVLRVCLSIVDIIFGAYFVHVQGVYICIYVKKKKKKKKKEEKMKENH